jgi:tetratricopeptide (TPR) repeat protein
MLHNVQSVLRDIKDATRRVEEEDFEGALPILARVVAFGPNDVAEPAYQLWALCHLRLGRIERALQIADEGLAKGFLPFELQLVRAEALVALDRFDEAAAAADAAHELEPDAPDPVHMRATIEIDRGDLDTALPLLTDARRRYPDDEAIHFALLEVAEALQLSPLVIESARDYLRNFEKGCDVLAMLGRAYLRTEDYRRADRAFRDAAELHPEELQHHMEVLMVAVMTNHDAAYDAYLERLARRDPELAEEAARKMGEALSEAGRPAEPGGRAGRRRRPGNR